MSLFIIVSIEEWKKELTGYLIDYDSLDIKDTVASGLWIYNQKLINFIIII